MQRYQRTRSLCQGQRRGSFLTVTALGLAIAIMLLGFLVFGQQHSSTLRFLTIMFRHGDRTPTYLYPTDPHSSPQLWPEGLGALTKEGKRQMYELGQYLRTRYTGFLSDIYSPNEVLIKSSDHDRCLMSADTLLAGLFPPKDFQVWNPDLKWQPIPVHATPRLLDKLIVVKKPCPKYDEELSQVYKSQEVEQLDRENSALYKYLSEHTGHAIDNITAVESLYNTLEIEELRKLQLPQWTKEYYPDKMRELAARSLAIFTHTPYMTRMKGGPLVAELRQNMYKKNEGTLQPDRRFVLYSVHDLTLVNVLRALGFTELIKPEFGASLIFELHEPKADIGHELKVFYMNTSTTESPHPLQIPKCETPCFLETFLKVTNSYVPTDWEEECILNF